MNKIDYRHHYILVVDTETANTFSDGKKLDYSSGLVYDCGFAVVDTKGNVYETFSFVNSDIFGIDVLMQSAYYANKIYESDPFARLDQNGVGKLVKMAAQLGRETRSDLKLGICGEHGGDPSSVEFCHNTGLAYVSCSPFRVPIARLAAAQAAIKAKK